MASCMNVWMQFYGNTELIESLKDQNFMLEELSDLHVFPLWKWHMCLLVSIKNNISTIHNSRLIYEPLTRVQDIRLFSSSTATVIVHLFSLFIKFILIERNIKIGEEMKNFL